MNHTPSRLIWYGLVTALAVVTYFFGLDSQHIPKNGDEYPFEHITRLTASSGELLPLRSELPNMRNTKPPLLFWQGIVSTNWGRDWTLWSLRYPSVVYTLLTGLLVFLLGRELSGKPETGFLAVLSFLAFFSTYRYGRPFLTNPPEVFWLFLPPFMLLYWRPAAFSSRFLFPALMGIGIGVGTLYKSFALVLPVSLGLAWWYLHLSAYRLTAFSNRDGWKVVVTASISLALFSSWFLLDPDPRGVWNEFVLGENLGKFALPGGYIPRLLWGTSSLWSLALGYPLNAGLLGFPVVALFLGAYHRRRELSEAEKLLWIWVLTLFLVFSLPSQRSSRYLLAAMPGLAVLLALAWQRISRGVFALGLLATAAAVGAMALLSVWTQHFVSGLLFPSWYWVLLAGTGGFAVLAALVPSLTRGCVHAPILLCYLSFAAFLRPLDGPRGGYDADVQRYLRGKDVWVPYDFVASYERYRFILPGAHIHGYRESRDLSVADLVERYRLVAVPWPLQETAPQGGVILGQRLDLRGRQSARELGEILGGKVSPHLLVRELLIEAGEKGPVPTTEAVEARPR